MTIFINSMKRLLKNKVQIVIMLILPFLPIIPIAADTYGSARTLNIGVADYDRTELTSALISSLESDFRIITLRQEEIESSLINSKVEYAIVIEKGFTGRIINAEDARIKGYAKEKTDMTPLVKGYIDSYINPVKSIAKASNKDSDTFYKGLRLYNKGNITEKYNQVKKIDKVKSQSVWGMVIQFMMFSSVLSATLLITDKENKTLFRTLCAPVTVKSYMLQTMLSFFAISVLQVVFLILASVYGFGTYPGSSILNMFLLLLVVSLVGVSMGVAVSSFCKNLIQASVCGVGIVVFMCMIGGAWGGTPSGFVKNIARLTPVSWAMEGIKKLMDGSAISSITDVTAILLLFAVVFFLLGTWRKTDIAK